MSGGTSDKKTLQWDSRLGPVTPNEENVARPSDDRHYLLVFEKESSSMFELPRNGEASIGRADGCDIVLSDPLVSRNHATVKVSDGVARITDLGSANGTRVNGERLVATRVLSNGDAIQLCGTIVHYHTSARPTLNRPLLDWPQLRARAEEELERALRFRRPLSILVLSLGGAADRPRVQTAIQGKVRLTDVLGWGGADHLVALLFETDRDGVPGVASRFLAALSEVASDARAGYASCPLDGCDVDTLVASARAAARTGEKGRVIAAPQASVTLEVGGAKVLVSDAAMARLYGLIERLAASDLPVLIQGETGTGKEVACSALHEWSRRKAGPLVTVNCAAIPESLVESELFGHEKGAFSGATAAKVGLLETGDGGTVFLDEIGELPAAAQAKLLRVLETRRLTRVGDVREREIDLRVVAATNRNLKEEVKGGRFRQDLYFRLSGAMLWIPPLRDRASEIPLLAQAFLAEGCARVGRPNMTISGAAMQGLARYAWPGNVRELRNAMHYVAATAAGSELEPSHLREIGTAVEEASADPGPAPEAEAVTFRPIDEEVRQLERSRMAAALKAADGHQRKAAALISMPLRTFVAKLKLYQLVEPRDRGKGR